MSTRHIAAEHAEARDLTPQGMSGAASKRFRNRLASDGFAIDEGWRPKPGYVYTVVRAISARVNQNYDGWPSEELKKSYKTFIGKPVFVNHENHDPTKARGVVVAARYAENGMDKYIETVMEVDAGRFPKLAHEIKTGGLDSVSMGAEAGFTICSYCHNKATDLHDMCEHVQLHKGKTLSRLDRKTGKREEILVFESCHKISFFELSYVFEPADETAVASKVVVASHGPAHTPPETGGLWNKLLDTDDEFLSDLKNREKLRKLKEMYKQYPELKVSTRVLEAGDCPPGVDCSRGIPGLEQITKDSPNNPVNQVSSDPSGTGGISPATLGQTGTGATDSSGKLLPGTQALSDTLSSQFPGIDIGGWREDPAYPDEHPAGKAIDFMTSDLATGNKALSTGWSSGADYAIWQNKMHYPDGTTKPYTGPNPHTDHVHFHHPGTAPAAATTPAQTKMVTPRISGKYTKDDFAIADGKKPWERDKPTRAPVEDEAADLKEIEAMIRQATPSDDYFTWKAEHGDEADHEHAAPGWAPENPNLKRWVEQVTQRHRHIAKLAGPAIEAMLRHAELDNSVDTQRSNTIATYKRVHDFFDQIGAPNEGGPDGVLDYGSGLGHSGRFGHTFEPNTDRITPGAGTYPDWIDDKDIPQGTFNRITNLHVLNVVPPEIREHIVKGIGSALAPGGHAVIVTRHRSDVDSTKNKEPVGKSDPGAWWIGDPKKPGTRTRQRGFTSDELAQLVGGHLGGGYSVKTLPIGSVAAVHIVKHPEAAAAAPNVTARLVRSAALKKIARNSAIRLAYGEVEAPARVDTLRQEGTAPEDDNNDDQRYVDPADSDFASMIQSPSELQTPDLSEAGQIDRQQEEDGQSGIPGPAEGGPAPQDQGNFITLKIPVPQEAPQVPQQAGPPVATPPGPAMAPQGPAQPPADPMAPQAPAPVTASLLDYFDGYYGRRVANWLDAIEAGRQLNPAEVADYRRQTEKFSTLENGRELSTTDRYPRKGTANMARTSIANRSKVANAGRRQHFAEGPLVDGGDRSRNDQGEQEEVFLSQTPPEEGVVAPTDDSNISNTEHNLVARVQQGRAQLMRDAEKLAALQRRRAVTEAGGPTAVVVDPTVNAGPEAEALTGTDFISADPNDGVVPTNPKDASLRAFQAFDGWLSAKTGKSSRRHTEANIKKAAAAFSREAGISPQALFPALGIVLREARKNDKIANTKGAKMRKRADEKLEVAAPDGRVDVEAPVSNTTDAEAQASQFDIHDFGNNAGDNVADPDLSTDQNWAPGEASKTSARVKTAGGLLAMRCAEGMIEAGLEPDSRERKYQLAAEFEQMNRGLIQDRVALLERFAAVRQAERRKVASGSSRGAARSPIPAGLGGGTRTAAAGQRLAAHDPSNDSSLFI